MLWVCEGVFTSIIMSKTIIKEQETVQVLSLILLFCIIKNNIILNINDLHMQLI